MPNSWGAQVEVNVSLTLMGIITGRGMATPMEIARVEETAQGGVTPTISIMNQMVAILMEVKGMAPTTTAITANNSNDSDRRVVATTTNNRNNGNDHYLADIGMPDWNQE
jgi:hypothetical protein